MEVPAGKGIRCCGPKIWIRFIGGIQLFTTILLGVVVTPAILTAASQVTGGKTDKEIAQARLYAAVGVGVWWGVIGLSILVEALLLVGNEKGRTGFFRPWLICQWIGTVVAGLGAITALFTFKILTCLSSAVQALVGGFMIYVVHQRRTEILAQTTIGVYAQI